MSDNRLKDETSPYLRQHADNPVNWRPWGPEAFAEAERENKPILLSVGYAACHWCHVMAHESFEDPEIARVMNEYYVNIKLDREERPDVDQLYMNALQLLGVPGGWPLTMFLTPDRHPVWGGTYFPKEPRYGQPGFPQVLTEFARLYREAPDRIAQNREAIRQRLEAPPPASEGGQLDASLVPVAAEQLLTAFDSVNGGLKGAPKFSQPGIMRLMWRGGLASGRTEFLEAVAFALSRMSRGGIYDHLGGGFARYSVDEAWRVPHFEKMLYDNGLILDLLTLAWLRTGDTLFRERICGTVDWLLREMRTDEGAFAASLDADTAGEEGLFYTWTRSEIADQLGSDAEFFCRTYGVSEEGNFEGRNVLNRLDDPFPLSDDEERRLHRCREILFAARQKRERPARDHKILADWNGMAIAGLARAGSAMQRGDWIAAAQAAFAFIRDELGRGDRLAHAFCAGKHVFPGNAGDYAMMIDAALALHQAMRTNGYLEDARRWAEAVESWHGDGGSGGYFLAASDASDLMVRLKHGQDDAVPNPNAVMAENLVRLWQLTGDTAYRDRVDALFAFYAADIRRNALAHAGLLSALDLRQTPVQIVVVGEDKAPGRAELSRAAHAVADPNRIIMEIEGETALPDAHPAAGKGTVDGHAAAYVCLGARCSLPVTRREDLPAHLRAGSHSALTA